MKALSDTLTGLSVWFDRITDGTHAWTPEGQVAFGDALRQAAVHAEGLEAVLPMLEARQMQPVSLAAVLDGIASKRVAMLGTHRTIAAFGLDALPERGFGEDGGGAA